MFFKNSFESFSFQLTQQKIELTPKSINQSTSRLDYSESNVSINELINDEPFLSLHIQHQEIYKNGQQEDVHNFRQRNSHFFEFNKGLRCCLDNYISKVQLNRPSLVSQQHQNSKQKKQSNSYSKSKRIKQSNGTQKSEEKNTRHINQPIHSAKMKNPLNQNVESPVFTNKQKNKIKSANQIHFSTSKQNPKQYKRSFKKNSHQQFPKITNRVVFKRLDLTENQLKAKRNMKKMSLNRQVILRTNHKICTLPIL